VTGGAGNLALVGARALLEHGLLGLALFDLIVGEESEGIAELKRDFPDRKIVLKKVDVTDEAGVNRAVEETARELGSG
jgi:sorbose reductase